MPMILQSVLYPVLVWLSFCSICKWLTEYIVRHLNSNQSTALPTKWLILIFHLYFWSWALLTVMGFQHHAVDVIGEENICVPKMQMLELRHHKEELNVAWIRDLHFPQHPAVIISPAERLTAHLQPVEIFVIHHFCCLLVCLLTQAEAWHSDKKLTKSPQRKMKNKNGDRYRGYFLNARKCKVPEGTKGTGHRGMWETQNRKVR